MFKSSRFGTAIATVALCLSATQASAGGEALFGLTFGMSVAQVKRLVPDMTMFKGTGHSVIYKAKSMPKNLSDTEEYSLVFVNDKLLKLNSIGNTIKNDADGSKGKARFSTLKKSLDDKYGKATSEGQHTGLKLYQETDEFYQCLAYDGCGIWSAVYEPSGRAVVLQLNGISRGTGWVDIVAESVPEWGDSLKQKAAGNNASDKNAL